MKYFQFVLIPNRVNLVSVLGRRRGSSWKVYDGKYLSKRGMKYLSETEKKYLSDAETLPQRGADQGWTEVCRRNYILSKKQDQVLTFTAKTMRITSQSDPLCNSVSLPPEKLRPPFFFCKMPSISFSRPALLGKRRTIILELANTSPPSLHHVAIIII